MKPIVAFVVFCLLYAMPSVAQQGSNWQNDVAFLKSQQESIQKELRALKRSQSNNKEDIGYLSVRADSLRHEVDSLVNLCRNLQSVQAADRSNINSRMEETNSNVMSARSVLSSRTVQGIAAIAIILILLLALTYYLTSKVRKGGSSIDEVRRAQELMQAAQVKMQEESVKLDNKLLGLAEKQIAATPATEIGHEIDHSLALKVADEIVRIELNLSRMDPSVKGYKQLSKAVQRIKDNFKANGYEFVEMLGKPYNGGMKVTANFVADENLPEGQQIVTGITKPQINYNGKMIQAAQITVSQNI